MVLGVDLERLGGMGKREFILGTCRSTCRSDTYYLGGTRAACPRLLHTSAIFDGSFPNLDTGLQKKYRSVSYLALTTLID
eukprot:scaffold3596_cov126-Cylindrotheca_fusiformis.AAC.13